MYFDNDTTKHIIQYIKLKPHAHDNKQTKQSKIKQRNDIFQKHIYKPFFKIAQSIVNKYKFGNYSYASRQQIINDTVAHLYQKLDYYNFRQFSNAFGYFSVIAKYYLQQLSMKDYKQACSKVQYEYDDDTLQEMYDHNYAQRYLRASISLKTVCNVIDFLQKQKQMYFKRPQQLQVIQALIFLLHQIINDRDLLSQFDKKHIAFKQLLSLLKQMCRCERYYVKRVLDKLSNILIKNADKLYQEYRF